MADSDYLLALKLQEKYDKELNDIEPTAIGDNAVKVITNKQAPKRQRVDDLNCTNNLVHPEWETLDPTPDVHAMFYAFDDKFFQKRLRCVILEWSKRMYQCAGICYSKKNSIGMSITIRLSEPLLKLRPRKDLVETLLHEMIHAYCFVLGIREGNGGHGPNFKKIMHGINKVAGTNITVYHTFHDEVDLYKIHWWRCNGICQHRKPFFGYVKRTSNRAPNPNDFWWRAHVESCGGTFLKIKGPEPITKKGKKGKEFGNGLKNNESAGKSKDIRKFFGNNTESGKAKTNGGGTIVLNPNNKNKTATINKNNDFQNKNLTKPFTSGGNLNNVVGLKNLGEEGSSPNKSKSNYNKFPEPSRGYSLSSSENSIINNDTSDRTVDHKKLRDVWSQKFAKLDEPDKKEELINLDNKDLVKDTSGEKRRRLSEDWEVLSDDLCVKNVEPEIINLTEYDSDDNEPFPTMHTPKIQLTQKERQVQIKKEIMDNSDLLEDDIELIDDDYDDSITNIVDLADTSLIDDFFGDDILLKEFKVENSLIPSGSRTGLNHMKDIITCPVCQSKIPRENLEDHLDGCIGMSTKVEPKKYGGKIVQGSRIVNRPSVTQPKLNTKQKTVLKKAGYTEEEIKNMKITNVIPNVGNVSDDSDEDLNLSAGQRRRRGLTTSTHTCPKCGEEVYVGKIDEHLKICNQILPSSSSSHRMSTSPQIIPFQICPVCNKKIKENVMNEHLDLCLGEFHD